VVAGWQRETVPATRLPELAVDGNEPAATHLGLLTDQ
jgi:hypothetical protein